MSRRTYLDHAATTPLRPEAAEAMRAGFDIWANPSSPHAEGRKAREALEEARARMKRALGWEGEVIFTSGASEAALLAFDNSVVLDEVLSAVEHDSILAFEEQRGCEMIAVRPDGSVQMADVDRNSTKPSVGNDTENRRLVAIQHVNSETGNRQDIGMAAEIVHGHGGLLLVDCAQSAGKFPIPQIADMAIVSAHKFGGPIGVGALLVRDYAMLAPSGGQERGYRRGTENVPGVLGMVAALEACGDPYLDPSVLEPVGQFAQAVRDCGGVWLSDRLSDPTPYIHAIAMPGVSGSAQLMRFDMAGFAISQGSACSSGSLKQSHVLAAMGLPEDVAARTIRLSFGWNTAREDIERFAEAWLAMARGG